jgi:hypothetical protein
VAIKLLHADQTGDPAARARFVREAMAAKKVARFCAAQVLDADVDGDRPYIVSEYVEGPSLAELVRDRGPISGGALERLAIGTATALVAIHQAGIVHRDLKPANVLVAQDGPRVIDFGIAKALDGTATVSSRVVGTPAYMAPEQLQGVSIGPAVDVFAWAALMTFAATGLPPFGMDSIPLVVNRILNADPQLGGLSGSLRDLVSDCLAKDPAQRPTARRILLRLLGQETGVVPLTGPDMVGTEVLQQAATLAATRFPLPAPVARSSFEDEAIPPAAAAPYDATRAMADAPYDGTKSMPYYGATQSHEYGLPPVADFPQAGYAPQRRRGRGLVALACAGGAAALAVAGALLLSSQSPVLHVKDTGSTSKPSGSVSGNAGGGTDSAPRQPVQRAPRTGGTTGGTNGGTSSGTNGGTGGTGGGTYGGTNGGTNGWTNGGTDGGTTGGTNGGGTSGPTDKPTDGTTSGPTDGTTSGPTDKPGTTGGTTSGSTGTTKDGSSQPSNCGYAGCT